MFELPRYVIKAGQVLIDEGELREPTVGKTLHVAPDYDRDVESRHRPLVRDLQLHPLPQLPGRRRVPGTSTKSCRVEGSKKKDEGGRMSKKSEVIGLTHPSSL